jgi:hypothetical protein
MWAAASFAGVGSVHQDYRMTPRAIGELDFRDSAAQSSQELSQSYLEKNLAKFGVASLADLQFEKVTESLLGQHFHFQQLKSGIVVDGGEIIISVAAANDAVFKVFNNFYPEIEPTIVHKKLVGPDAALDLAWNDLRVHGNLLAEPRAALQYRVSQSGKFVLGYKTVIEIEAPAGAWEQFIDAGTGVVLSREDITLERIKKSSHQDIAAYHGLTWNRLEVMAKFAKKNLQSQQAPQKILLGVDGHGLVFDPDPRTSTMNPDLTDTSDEALFDSAYFERDLLGITKTDDKFQLSGPWVKIIDFESPNTAPSTTTDGIWATKRGTNAFNDAMTYFHIDQSQRYIQSLGFTATKGIQFGPIGVDSDGVNGDDNSHYIPSSNRLSFGHGCVDDNEDSDVILHEYGHAINSSINSNWSGGDTGAMGEGFGDYWAGSYSVSTPNGLSFQRDVVFNWDGTPCWSGRSLNAVGAMYNPSQTYSAHTSIPGGFQSDELWSTPIFQSLVVLMSKGIPRSEVDKIILEAQFGLGSGIKMRDMAKSILATAKTMFPTGIHASVFQEQFKLHKIVE